MISQETATLIKRIVVSVLGTGSVIALTYFLGHLMGTQVMQVEAVKLGHARHIIVDDLGHTKFQWLEKNDVAPVAAPAVK